MMKDSQSVANRKVREEKPFAVMFRIFPRSVPLSDNAAKRNSRKSARPIVLLARCPQQDAKVPAIAPSVAPRNRLLVRFSLHPAHYLLFDHDRYAALVLTSGNRSDEPIVTDNAEAAIALAILPFYPLS